jgi:hypothetical protein
VTWPRTTAWTTLKAGPKHTATFCMISHLRYELHQGVCSSSGALPQSLRGLAGVLSTLPNPSWHDPGASDRAQHLALQTPTSHQAKKRFRSTFWWSRTGKGLISSICSELGFCSHTGLNLAHGIIATLSGDMHVLTHRPVRGKGTAGKDCKERLMFV